MIKRAEFTKRVVATINKLEERKKVAHDLGINSGEQYDRTVSLWRSECMEEIESIYDELNRL